MTEKQKVNQDFRFFDSYPAFYKTSTTGSVPNRLNARYEALINQNKELIKGSRILDLASHDGRWSLAAIKNGAKSVTGIEARKELVKSSIQNMKRYDVSNYSFIVGDIFKEIKKVKKGQYDIIFCFGLFYHIMNHVLLLSEIKRINPKYLILDTNVEVSDQPVIFMKEESALLEGEPVPNTPIHHNKIMMGRPSIPALNMMLKFTGFSFEYYDWINSGITDWNNIETYRDGKRVSILARKRFFKV